MPLHSQPRHHSLTLPPKQKQQFLVWSKKMTIDLLLLGMNLPAAESLELARQLNEAGVPARILVLSAHDEKQYAFEMLAYGVALPFWRP
jgi:DNA-binding NarL/FixJ family response regulator